MFRLYRLIRQWQRYHADYPSTIPDEGAARQAAEMAHKKGYTSMTEIMGDESFWGTLWM